MYEEKTSRSIFVSVLEGFHYASEHLSLLHEQLASDAKEIEKLNSIIDELRDENERLKREAKGGGA